MVHRSCLLLSLMLASCSGKVAPIPDPAEKSTAASEKAHACSADAGSPLDVASEPPFRKHATYETWTDQDGCLVRIDVLFERPGPAHCNQQDTRVIGMGMPFGTRYTSAADTQLFIRDPNGAYRNPALVAGFNAMSDLPNNAKDTGLRRGEAELWIDPKESSGIYLKLPRRVERWPRGEVPPCQ